MARTLTIFSETFQGLVDQINVVLVDVQTKKSQSTSGAAAYTVKEGEGVTDQVIGILIILLSQVVLSNVQIE